MIYQLPCGHTCPTFLAVKSLDRYVSEFDDFFLYWSLIGQNMYIQILYLSRCLILTHPLCRSVIEGDRLVSLSLTANWLLGLHIPVMWDLCRVPSYLWDFKSPAPLKYCFSCDPRLSYLSKSWIISVIVVILIADKTCLWLIEGLDGWFCRCIIDPGMEWKYFVCVFSKQCFKQLYLISRGGHA